MINYFYSSKKERLGEGEEKVNKLNNSMKYKQTRGNEIEGHLDIFTFNNDNGDDQISIHGTPEGLKSLAKLLTEIAGLNQEDVEDKFLPIGAREHYHLRPNIELSKSSVEVIVGRLDGKGTKLFYNRYIPSDKNKTSK